MQYRQRWLWVLLSSKGEKSPQIQKASNLAFSTWSAQHSPKPCDPLNRLRSGQPCLWVLRLSACLWMQSEWQYYKDREASLLCQESAATLWLNNEMRHALSEMQCWYEPVHKKRRQCVVFFLMNKVWDACSLDCWCPFCFLWVPHVDTTAAVSAVSAGSIAVFLSLL